MIEKVLVSPKTGKELCKRIKYINVYINIVFSLTWKQRQLRKKTHKL